MGVRASWTCALVTALLLGLLMVPAADAAKTRVVRLNPFTSAGELAPGYQVTQRREGTCPQASFRAVGTYRCFGGNGIYEPCWPNPVAPDENVVCLRSPYSKRALRILLTEPPEENPSSGNLPPWWLTLSSGKRCGFIGGATAVIGGKRLNYFCSTRVALLGTPRKSSTRQWRIAGARGTRQGFVRGKTARVRVAYYGSRQPSAAIKATDELGPAARPAASYQRCSGSYTAPNGLGLIRIQRKGVSCATARKATVSWGRAWARADHAKIVRFTRVHDWRCVYKFVAFPDAGGYGRVICAAQGGLRVAFRASS